MKQLAIMILAVLALSALSPAQTAPAHFNVLIWPASLTPGVTYNVYRAPGSCSATFVKVNTSPITGLTFTDSSGLVGGAVNCYRVTAVSSGGTKSDANGRDTVLGITPFYAVSVAPAPPGQPVVASY